VISGVRGLYEKRIVRYPTPFYLRYQPEFPEPFKQLATKLKRAKGKQLP